MGEREHRLRDRRWLRVAAAAEILAVSQHTLRRWADAGVVPCRRTPSGQRQFLPSELARFLEECERGGHRDCRPGNGGNGRPDAGASGRPGAAATSVTAEPGERKLLELGREVARSCDPRGALGLIARSAAEQFGMAECLVCEHVETIDALVCRAGGDEATFLLAEWPEARVMLAGGEPLREPARLAVPFSLGTTIIGCLVLAGPGAERLTAGDVAAAGDFGGLAALAVHRLQTDRLRAEQKAHVESLLHAGRSITSSLVLQDVLDAVAREVVDTFGADYCVIWEYVEDQDSLVERAGYGVEEGFNIAEEVILLGERPREREILFGPSRSSRRCPIRPRRRQPGVDGALGRKDLPLAPVALRRRDARRAGHL